MLEMEEEMEGRMVVELVEELEVMVVNVAGQGGRQGSFGLLLASLFAAK